MLLFYWFVLTLCLSVTILVSLVRCTSRIWLTAFMAILTAYVGLIILDDQAFNISPKLYFLSLTLVFLPGPVLLGYITHISTRTDVHLKDFSMCALPSVIVLFSGDLIGPYGLFDLAPQTAYETKVYIMLFSSISLMAGLHMMIYLIRSLQLIHEMKKDWYSYESTMLPTRWHEMLNLWFVLLLSNLTQVVSSLMNPSGKTISIGDIGFMLLIWYFLYLSIKSTLRNLGLIQGKDNTVIVDTHTYLIESETHNRANQSHSFDEIQSKLVNSKLYLQSDLSLASAAHTLGITKHHLFDFLNQHAQKNFYTFINDLRITDAADMLIKKPETSVLEVYDASGFNSKLAFHQYFRKSFGYSPIQYKKQRCPTFHDA